MKYIAFLFPFLFITFHSSSQRLYFFDRDNVNKTEKVYVNKNIGFVRNLIDNSGSSTVLKSDFYDINAERKAEHSISFPKADYLGHAFNGEEHIYLFLDTYNGFVYIPRYSKTGTFITNQRNKVKSKVKNAGLVYYDSTAYYTVRRKGPRFTFSKVTYNYDTLWEKQVFDNGHPIILSKVEKFDSKIYLMYNSAGLSTRIISIDDSNGGLVFDKEIGDASTYRFASNMITDGGSKEVILMGIEAYGNKKSERDYGTFINKMGTDGNFKSTTFFSNNHIEIQDTEKLDKESKKRIKEVSILDAIKIGEEYVLIGENRFRTDFAGEGMAVSMIVTGLTGLPFSGVAVNNIVYTNFDLSLIKTEGSSLIYTPIAKSPIARFFPTIESSFNRESNELYDYKFSRDIPGGKEIFFFQNLTKDSFTLGSARILTGHPLYVKKLVLNEKNERGKNYNIYEISDENLLLQTKTNSSSGFGVVKFSRFE